MKNPDALRQPGQGLAWRSATWLGRCACRAMLLWCLALPGPAAALSAGSEGGIPSCPGPPGLGLRAESGEARSAASFLLQDQGAPPQRHPSCYGGRETRDFGWTLISYGVATLRYVVGLFLILIGGLFVALGSALSLLDWLLCWR